MCVWQVKKKAAGVKPGRLDSKLMNQFSRKLKRDRKNKTSMPRSSRAKCMWDVGLQGFNDWEMNGHE